MAKRKPRKLQGHPANIDRLRRGMDPEDPVTKRERAFSFEVREMARLVRREATANPQEGFLVGPLVAAAKTAAPLLCDRWNLTGDEHEEAVKNWLVEELGDVIDSADPVRYRDWREQCLGRVA